MSKVTSYHEAYGKHITLVSGAKFTTQAEHDAYVKGIEHACNSLEALMSGIKENAKVITYEDNITGQSAR